MGAASETTNDNQVFVRAGAPPRSTAGSGVRLGRVIALVTAATAITLLAGALMFALFWRGLPFPGILLTPSLVVDGTQPVEPGTWSGLNAGLQRLDRITAINGQPVSATGTSALYQQVVQTLVVDRVITVDFLRPAPGGVVTTDGGVRCADPVDGVAACSVALPVRTFPASDFVSLFLIPFASGVVVLLAGLVVLRLRPLQTSAQLVSITCSLLAIFMAGLFDVDTTHVLLPVWIIATVMLGAAAATLALVFPTRARILYRMPPLLYLPVALGAAIAAALVTLHFNPPDPMFAFTLFYLTVGVSMLGLAMLGLRAALRRASAASLVVRDQSNTVLIGIALAGLPVLVWVINFVARLITGNEPIVFNVSAGTPFFILPALALAYAVLQYRAVDTDRIISQGVTYTILLGGVVFGYFLVIFGVTLVARDIINPADTGLLALIVFAVALLLLPLRARLQQPIDALYYRTRRDYQQHIDTFAQQLGTLVSLNEVVGAYRTQIEDVLAPESMFVFLRDRATGEYTSTAAAQRTDVRFAGDSPLVAYLGAVSEPVYLEPGRPWPSDLLAERARLAILKPALLVGLRGSNELNGFVCIGAPRSGAGYAFEALRFVDSLTRQIGVTVERAEVVASLEQRVRELDVLSQVSQAVNFTSNFDDLLELIYTQATRLIDASHFYIVLRDTGSDELYYAFFVENDDRFRSKENRRWPLGGDLLSEVALTGQPLQVADYARAMAERNRPLQFEDRALKGWVGVPLIAGQRTMGVLAVGTTEPDAAFTREQVKALTDISALAATSLDKARLFDETNARARQLAALNDISRQLVASESDLGQLLRLITTSAVDILNAEAGSLLLVTEDGSGDLEFQVATGAARDGLVGQRLPAGQGLVGQVAATGEPVITNNALSESLHSTEMTHIGFLTRSVLAVPLSSQTGVIGVLEVLNRRGMGQFTAEDADLLSTLAGQAAVAIENARLFQMTDQQLSERVTELEMLERIDVELNRSLDLETVAGITVSYALQQSGATAALLGVITPEGDSLRIVATQGYEAAGLALQGSHWPLDQGIIRRVVRTRRAELVTDVSIDPDYAPGLPGAISQMTVPMLVGGAINALLILETDRPGTLTLAHMAFIQRLAEHASIAIANAQLYEELERANQSKSEFVSFVAHELKNPLTSIKGFSDVLISGAVGGLSDQQRTFLGTIRANAERMNTLVSDLNDVTKMQTNNFSIEPTAVNVEHIITESVRPLERQMSDKSQSLVLDMADDLPRIHGDANRLIQVLTNLLSNAHKYTPEGGTITLAAGVRDDLRDARGRALPPMLQVSVRDTGIGMSEEDVARLFTPYFRSDNPEARQQPGTGLGLTITYGIIQRHGGDIWVESALGEGTTFFFTVPLAAEEIAG